MCLCRISFLTILDIYKAYFRGRYIREYKEEHMQKVTDALFSLKEVIASFALYGFVIKCFLIFIIDKMKNFATNNLLQVGVLVTYWESYIIG